MENSDMGARIEGAVLKELGNMHQRMQRFENRMVKAEGWAKLHLAVTVPVVAALSFGIGWIVGKL